MLPTCAPLVLRFSKSCATEDAPRKPGIDPTPRLKDPMFHTDAEHRISLPLACEALSEGSSPELPYQLTPASANP